MAIDNAKQLVISRRDAASIIVGLEHALHVLEGIEDTSPKNQACSDCAIEHIEGCMSLLIQETGLHFDDVEGKVQAAGVSE